MGTVFEKIDILFKEINLGTNSFSNSEITTLQNMNDAITRTMSILTESNISEKEYVNNN